VAVSDPEPPHHRPVEAHGVCHCRGYHLELHLASRVRDDTRKQVRIATNITVSSGKNLRRLFLLQMRLSIYYHCTLFAHSVSLMLPALDL
jgi:hypothetical protein